tara:strand:- start:2712 stop:2978 length:267 start_codon:yes stop_codon:yes gene_type:complete
MDTNIRLIYDSKSVNNTTIWLLFIFLGWSYGSMGKVGKQLFFYLTMGGLGIWTLYRLFTLNKAIREFNKKIAIELGVDSKEIAAMGLY